MNAQRNVTLGKFLLEQRSIIALLVLIGVVSAINPNFFTVDNILNILRQTSVNAIIAVGMTFVILIAGIDLSVGSILALTGAFAASMVGTELSILLVIPAVLLIGTLLGTLSGVIVAGIYRHLSHHDIVAGRHHGLHRRAPYQYRLFRYGGCFCLPWYGLFIRHSGADLVNGDRLFNLLVCVKEYENGTLYLCLRRQRSGNPAFRH